MNPRHFIQALDAAHSSGFANLWSAQAKEDKLKFLRYLEQFDTGGNWNQWTTIKFEVIKLALGDSEAQVRLGALRVIEGDEIAVAYRLLNDHEDSDPEVAEQLIRIRGAMRQALMKSKLIRQWSRDGVIDYGGSPDHSGKWKVGDIPDTEFYRDLDEGMAGVIFILRNYGINTTCSCGHEGYIQCDDLTNYSSERSIESALYEANCLPYTLKWHKDRQVSGYPNQFLEIRSPTFQVLEPKR